MFFVFLAIIYIVGWAKFHIIAISVIPAKAGIQSIYIVGWAKFHIIAISVIPADGGLRGGKLRRESKVFILSGGQNSTLRMHRIEDA